MVAKAAAAAVLFASQICTAHAASYNAWANFSIKANPNGPWSYLAGGALLTQTIPDCNGNTKLLCWWNGQQPETSATVIANKTGAAISYETITLPAKYLSLDPENIANSTVQWTSPIAGTVRITGNFLAVDTSEASHDVAIFQNGNAIWNGQITTYGMKLKFKLNVTVNVGDTIDFMNITNTQYHNLSTGLQAVIKTQ